MLKCLGMAYIICISLYLGRTPMKDEHIFIVSTFYTFQVLKWCLPYKHMLFPIEPCFFGELVSL